MARRALLAVAFVALGAAGAASAGLVGGGEAGAGPAAPSCGAPATAAPTTSSAAAWRAGPETGIPTTTATSTWYTAPAPCATSGPATGGSRTANAGTSATSTAAAGTTTTAAATPPAATVTTSSSASTIVITGHGWGHGMGMSQWGAYGYARHGWSYERILLHYYRGTTIGPDPPTVIRVLLLDGKRRVTLDSASPWHVVDAAGTKLALPAGKLVVPASLSLSGRALISPLTFTPGASPLQAGGHPYRGNLLVVSNGTRLQVVDAVGLESYLDGVVGAEMPQDWPAAALEAQAVAARSYALSQLESVVTASPYDVFADTRSQVYGGIDAESPRVTAAVAATAGRVVLYQGKVATTYFSSSSGGRTASAAEAIGTPIPYLVSVRDPYDTYSPYHDWGPVLLNAAAAGKELGLGGPLADLETAAGPSGHVVSATAVGGEDRLKLSGAQVRSELGLRSSFFQVGWLTLTPPAAPVVYGGTVTLTGVARGLTGVSLEAKTAAGWQPVAAVATNGSGAFSIPVAPQSTTVYRLAAGDVRAAQVVVTVRPAISASRGRGGVQGAVRPGLPAATVALQREDGTRWTTVATATTSAGGAFAIQAKLTPGAYRVRSTPGHGLAPGASSPIAVS